jgi:hypothetical protein
MSAAVVLRGMGGCAALQAQVVDCAPWGLSNEPPRTRQLSVAPWVPPSPLYPLHELVHSATFPLMSNICGKLAQVDSSKAEMQPGFWT